MNHEYTIEILYHLTCSRCKGWWSHAHTPALSNNEEFQVDGPKKLMFCPHSRLEDMFANHIHIFCHNAVVRLLFFKKVKCTSLCGL